MFQFVDKIRLKFQIVKMQLVCSSLKNNELVFFKKTIRKSQAHMLVTIMKIMLTKLKSLKSVTKCKVNNGFAKTWKLIKQHNFIVFYY